MVRSRLLRALIARYCLVARGATLGVRVLAEDGGKVLLVRHGYADGWHLPGGGVEVGETPETAAARELLEETGVTAAGRPELFGLYFNPSFGGRDYVALYRVAAFEVGPEPAPNREIRESGWFPLDALPEATTAATRRRFAEVFRGAAPEETW